MSLKTGPFISRIRTRLPAVIDGIALLYADYPVSEAEGFADFHLALTQPPGARRWFRPQALFEFDGVSLFKPLPLTQALPMLEWGLNWCISNHAHHFLIIHAAAIERDGCAVILPGPPGSGKSTLTAFLTGNGWRLLSDELALLSLDDGRVTPLARPLGLKNQSIDLIGRLLPGARMSPPCADTTKGTVALLQAPQDSVFRSDETAHPAWIIFPRFMPGAEGQLQSRSKARTLIDVGHNAFNYSIHGKRGFELLSHLVDSCDCYDFRYSSMDQACRTFDALAPGGAAFKAASA
ncbi:HprK-related kinase A [Pelagibius marinus]|uniref:HprK-related kinase A n=1 Tax=Pelagibius marinus TaxID=2762760 RepID=UPI0029CA60C9|nr:HprK-related kinase A [Pelagibius marinus]